MKLKYLYYVLPFTLFLSLKSMEKTKDIVKTAGVIEAQSRSNISNLIVQIIDLNTNLVKQPEAQKVLFKSPPHLLKALFEKHPICLMTFAQKGTDSQILDNLSANIALFKDDLVKNRFLSLSNKKIAAFFSQSNNINLLNEFTKVASTKKFLNVISYLETQICKDPNVQQRIDKLSLSDLKSFVHQNQNKHLKIQNLIQRLPIEKINQLLEIIKLQDQAFSLPSTEWDQATVDNRQTNHFLPSISRFMPFQRSYGVNAGGEILEVIVNNGEKVVNGAMALGALLLSYLWTKPKTDSTIEKPKPSTSSSSAPQISQEAENPTNFPLIPMQLKWPTTETKTLNWPEFDSIKLAKEKIVVLSPAKDSAVNNFFKQVADISFTVPIPDAVKVFVQTFIDASKINLIINPLALYELTMVLVGDYKMAANPVFKKVEKAQQEELLFSQDNALLVQQENALNRVVENFINLFNAKTGAQKLIALLNLNSTKLLGFSQIYLEETLHNFNKTYFLQNGEINEKALDLAPVSKKLAKSVSTYLSLISPSQEQLNNTVDKVASQVENETFKVALKSANFNNATYKASWSEIFKSWWNNNRNESEILNKAILQNSRNNQAIKFLEFSHRNPLSLEAPECIWKHVHEVAVKLIGDTTMPATFRNFYMRADQDYHDKLFGDFDALEKKLGQSHIRIYDRTLPEALVTDPLWVELTPSKKNSILSDSAKLSTICKTLKERYHKRLVIDNYLDTNLSLNYFLLDAVKTDGSIDIDVLCTALAPLILESKNANVIAENIFEALDGKNKKSKTQATNTKPAVKPTGSPQPPLNDDDEDKNKNKETLNGKNATNKMARKIAEELGFKETKEFPFNSQGELVFKKGNRYISLDRTSHKGGFWKLFEKARRIGTYNINLTELVGS